MYLQTVHFVAILLWNLKNEGVKIHHSTTLNKDLSDHLFEDNVHVYNSVLFGSEHPFLFFVINFSI